MDEQMMFKNIFSVLNVFIITYLMMNQTQDTNHKNRHFHMFCFSSTVLLRIFINYVSIHILYHYMVIIVICIIIGRFVFLEYKVFADFTVFRTIKNEDLCVIVSNTVDNALRECQLMKAENPETECLIQLKAKKRKGFLSIVCENSLRKSQAELLRTNITMKTSKEDKINHGFGVRNIKDIVKEYDGEVVFHVIDDMFSVSIIIPMHMI